MRVGSKSRDPLDLFMAVGSGCHALVSRVIASHELGELFITEALEEMESLGIKAAPLNLLGRHLRIAMDAVQRGISMDQAVYESERKHHGGTS